jgi:hypothetical protein
MICPKCKTANDDQYVFCVNCGASLAQNVTFQDIEGESTVPPTVREVRPQVTRYTPENSEPTVFRPNPGYQPQPTHFVEPPRPKKGGSTAKIIVLLVLGVILIGVVGAGAFGVYVWQKASAEVLPDHLGMFSQNAERNRIEEIKKLDLTNALAGKDSMLKDEGLPVLDPSPTLILYSDGKDVPVSDLRLIQLDTIKEDGSFKQIDFQASPIDSKPEMKRLKTPEALANGRYAFALIDGFLNDGKHKFWAFQVRNTAKPDNNGASTHAVTVALKPTPTPTPTVKPSPTPNASPPPGATVAYTTTNSVILRSGASQDSAKIRNLRKGEKLYVFRYSQNTEVFDGIESAFAFVQTENGQTGWVFAAFLR